MRSPHKTRISISGEQANCRGGAGTRGRQAGFSLIEFMVTVAVAAVLLGLALPSFTASIRSNRVSSAANTLLATVNFARMEAMRSKETARICPNNNGTCGGSWSQGLLVWTDEDRSGGLNGEEVRRIVEPQNGVVVNVAGANVVDGVESIAFSARGRRIGAANTVIEIMSEVCDKGAANRRSIAINAAGHADINREECP
jgi:type IV fimbrial biogenesis protein FimT